MNEVWRLIRNPALLASSNSTPKNVVVSNDNTSESSKPIKKAISMDNLKPKPINVKKENDENLFSNDNWITSEKDEKKLSISEYSTASSQDETYVIALIGKPTVGKSTIVRTGLNNLKPITNFGTEHNGLKAPTMSTEIEVDDQSYPVEVLELQEDVFNMKSPSLQWPKELPEIDGILVCYDVTSRESIANIAWLLNAFKEFQIPTILAACKTDHELSKRKVDVTYGPKLGDLFSIGFVELDTRSDAGIQKIHDVFSMLLRLSIRHREFSRKKQVHKPAESSSDSLFLQNLSSDAESDKISLSHRRTSSDLSHESRGRRRFSAVRFVSNRYSAHFGTPKTDPRKLRNPLSVSSDDEVTTPPPTPPTPSILTQMTLPPTSSPPNKFYHSEKNSNRRSILPSTTLLQVKEAEEEKEKEKDVVTRSINIRNSRVSTASYDSTLSSMSGKSDTTWDGSLYPSEFDRIQNKCTGTHMDGMKIDELIHRLTTGGQYGGTHDDPFTITFFVLYRTFMRPREVLVKLMQRFHECEKDTKDSKDNRNTTHEKICNLLYHWITQHPNDMIHPHTRILLRKFFDTISKSSHLAYYSITLRSLVYGTVPEDDPDASWGLSDVDDNEISEDEFIRINGGIGNWSISDSDQDDRVSLSQLNRPSLLKNHRQASIIIVNSTGRPICQVPFEELTEKSIANELTYQEFQLFKKIAPRDLLRHIWSPQGSPQRENGKIAQSIKHFNLISNWVSTIILSQDKLKSRAAMLKKFMKVAIIVRESNNYNTLMAIIAAINSAPIARLRRTRELIKGKSTYKKFHNLEVLMSTERSFGNYRLALKAPSRGHDEQLGIPYLGIHLQDLLSLGEGNRDFQEDGKVHWTKFSLMGDIINMIRNFQKKSYDVKSDKLIEKFITDTTVLNDDDLYNKSLELEPRIQRSASASRVRRST